MIGKEGTPVDGQDNGWGDIGGGIVFGKTVLIVFMKTVW